MPRVRTTIDVDGTRAQLDGLHVAMGREAEGSEVEPFDKAMGAALAGAPEASESLPFEPSRPS